MQQRSLRTVVLIQAIEETDRNGEVIPLADRAEASRVAAREVPKLAAESQPPAALSPQAEDFLARRAERLLERLRARAPAVMQALSLAGGISWLGRLVLVLALVSGVSLSTLDGSRQINILALPLVGLLAWNLLVYVLLLVGWLRSRGRSGGSRSWAASLYERWIAGRIESLMRHSTRYNVPLSQGLRRFAADWGHLSQPIIILRAQRLLHLGAALLALGLIAGLYFRGLVLRYEAGWESTFLGPGTAYAVITALYGPASLLSGIPIGTLDQVAALRWTATGGGGEAASWIHLVAITTALYIVVPRLLAALACVIGLWRYSRRMPHPPGMLGYARALIIGTGDGAAGDSASVVPYAYEIRDASIAGLHSLLAATLGANLKVQVEKPVKYGDEATLVARLEALTGSWHVMVMTLASTPEVENHGAFLSAWRDWLARHARSSPLLILIDEGPYSARMRGDVAFEQRIQERRKLWREFVAGYGLRAVFADLMQIKPGAASEVHARDEARAALWTASELA